MLALAQAFMTKPRLLLVDELSLGLAPTVVGHLLDVLRAAHAAGTTIVIVEQSVNVALTLAQRAVFMEKGEVRFTGPTADLLERPDLLRSVFIRQGPKVAAAPLVIAARRRCARPPVLPGNREALRRDPGRRRGRPRPAAG